MSFYIDHYLSPIGKLIIVCEDNSLIGLFIEGQTIFSKQIKELKVEERKDVLILNEVKKWLDDYFMFKHPNPRLLRIKLNGTEFQKRVWNLLLDIPYGEVRTYKSLGEIIAKERNLKKMSSQAIGQAVGHNPISIIIPCHRVIGSYNKLTGYNGGIDKKIELLKIENVDLTNFK